MTFHEKAWAAFDRHFKKYGLSDRELQRARVHFEIHEPYGWEADGPAPLSLSFVPVNTGGSWLQYDPTNDSIDTRGFHSEESAAETIRAIVSKRLSKEVRLARRGFTSGRLAEHTKEEMDHLAYVGPDGPPKRKSGWIWHGTTKAMTEAAVDRQTGELVIKPFSSGSANDTAGKENRKAGGPENVREAFHWVIGLSSNWGSGRPSDPGVMEKFERNVDHISLDKRLKFSPALRESIRDYFRKTAGIDENTPAVLEATTALRKAFGIPDDKYPGTGISFSQFAEVSSSYAASRLNPDVTKGSQDAPILIQINRKYIGKDNLFNLNHWAERLLLTDKELRIPRDGYKIYRARNLPETPGFAGAAAERLGAPRFLSNEQLVTRVVGSHLWDAMDMGNGGRLVDYDDKLGMRQLWSEVINRLKNGRMNVREFMDEKFWSQSLFDDEPPVPPEWTAKRVMEAMPREKLQRLGQVLKSKGSAVMEGRVGKVVAQYGKFGMGMVLEALAMEMLASSAEAAGFSEDTDVIDALTIGHRKLGKLLAEEKQPLDTYASSQAAKDAKLQWGDMSTGNKEVFQMLGSIFTGGMKKAWTGFNFIMEEPRHLFMQEVVGSGVKAGEWANLWRAQWDDPDHKQFRYHNAQVFREQAGMLWAIWESLEWQPGKTFAYGVNWEKAQGLVSSGEADRWAEANPEAVDQIFKIPLDPWFLAGAGVRLAQGTMKPLHIKYLLPIAQRMRQAAKNGTSAMRVAYELHGPDLGLSFLKGVLTAPSDLKAAEFMYTEGARSAPWTMGLAEVLPIPKYFKRAGEAYSPQLREKAEQMVEHRTAVKEAYHAALQKIQEQLPWLDEQGLKNAQRLLEIIPRESSAPGLSFRRNYWQALNHPGAGATAKQVGQWKFVQSTTPEEFKAAEIMAETIGAAWRPGTPWRANYSPGWVAVMRKEGSAAAQALIAKMGKAGQGISQVAAPWRKKRLLSPKQFKLRENLEKWISHVATREFRKGELDPFLRELDNHRAMLKHGMKNTADKAIKAALERDISNLEQMAKELKGFRESGIIDEMDKLSPGSKGTVNAFLRGWARVIGWERKLQIGATPAFHVRNFVDSHLVRNALKMGEVELPAGKEIWDGAIPLRTPSGKALSFGRGQTAAIFGDDPKGIAAIGKNIEDTARNILGQRVFAEKMGEYINHGIPLSVAEEKAITIAKRVVNEVHVNYDDIAPFVQHMSQGGASFPNFNLANFVYWGTQAVTHPSEATALMRAYEVADKLSPDGKGGYNIPGTDMGVDLRSYASNTRLLKLASNPEYKLTYSERPAHKLYSAAELAMGGMTAPLDWVARKLDIQPKNPDPELSIWDDVVAAVSNSVKGERFRPTAELLRLTGMQDPGNPDGRREFEMKKLLRASELDGKPLSAEQANNLLKNMEAVNVLFGFTMGMYPKRMTPGSVQVEKGIQTYYRIYGAVEPHLGPKVKEYLDSQYPWMQGISPEPPIQKVIREQQKEIEQEQNEDLELRRKQASASEGLGMAIAATPLGRIASAFSGTAQAAEGEDSVGKARKIRVAAEYDQVRGGWYPKGLPADISKVGTGQVKSGIENNIEREELIRQLDRMPKFSDQEKLIDDTPNAWDMLVKTPDKRTAPIIDSYTQAKAGQLVEMPSAGIYSKQQNYVRYWKKWVDDGLEVSPAENARRLNAPMDVLAKELKLPPTHSVDRLDDYDLAVFRSRYSSDGKRVEMAKRMSNDPEASHWIRHLISQQKLPMGMTDAVDKVNDAITAGTLRPDFWKTLKSTHTELYENVARLDEFRPMMGVANAIAERSASDGRVTGIFIPRLMELARQGYGPHIAALRDFGPPDISRELRQLTQEQPELMAAVAPVAPEFTGNLLRNFEERVGVAPKPFSFAPQQIPASNFQPATPLGPAPTDNFPQMTYSPRAGGAELAAQFTTAPAMDYSSVPRRSVYVNTQNYSSVFDVWRGVVTQRERDMLESREFGIPEPSWGTTMIKSFRKQERIVGPDGRETISYSPAMSPQLAVSTIASAQSHLNFLQQDGLVPQSEVADGVMNGLKAALSTMTDPAGLALNAGTFGAYGAYVGIKTGLGMGKKGRDGGVAAAENARINQERLDLQRQQFAEQLRQQSIRDIRQREQDLGRAVSGGFKPQGQEVQQKLQTFQRRGTFASKLGLIDAMERELSSALKPRW